MKLKMHSSALSRKRRRGRVPLAVTSTAAIASCLLMVPSGAASALTNTSAGPEQLAQALAADPSVVSAASFLARPSDAADALMTAPLAGFPTDGSSYALLTTGDATLAGQPNSAADSGVDDGGPSVRGDTDYDVTVLKVDLDVPQGDNCLLGLDFRFLSEEYPEYVGTDFNDAFVAELDKSTWTTSGSAITAPDNFAFDPTGNPITINAAGVTSMTSDDAVGTTYDGATPMLTAATPITPGAHSLYLSIFDQGDHIYDSGVMLDNLRLGAVADPATDCVPGAKVVHEPLTVQTSVSPLPLDPDPASAAFVRLTIEASYQDGTPAAGAAVKMSNADPSAVFHTDDHGDLSLVESVDVMSALESSVTASVTAPNGDTGSATQTLYQASEQAMCSFQGRPGLDMKWLAAMLPDPMSEVHDILQGLASHATKLHTTAYGYRIDVPGSTSLYAQTMLITKGGSTAYVGAGYSAEQILQPPNGWLQSHESGCSGPVA